MRFLQSMILGAALAGGAAAQAPASEPSPAAPLAVRPQLTLHGAKQVAAAAVAEARRRSAPGAAIAVADAGGSLLYLERLDGTFPMAGTVSAGKARTAALFQKPTRVFEDVINKGRTAMTALADFTPLQGGVPIVVDGQVVGAVGVSGAASATQDDEIATAAAAVQMQGAAVACCDATPGPVVHLDAARVQDAFAKGQPLLETAEYKIHASRRDAAGLAEVHADETDVIHVLTGQATFVTGGRVVEPRTTAPQEVRGSGIEGGAVRTLAPGDVVVVPRGTPHWFQRVEAPFTYFVVKVLHAPHESGR
ncbi:MAG: heme-binding protein [Planctomycetes bacterium]|nr:heme-binding protein [Planctomycetota bacterium]